MTDVPTGGPASRSPRVPHPFTHEVVDALVYQVKGMCIALEEHTELGDQIDSDQAARWAKELDSSVGSLRNFATKLREYTRAD